jgi:Ca2+-binding RTX toxin-like protein
MTTLSATAKSLLNLHYAILGSQPTLAQLNTYAGEYNKARAAGATADAAMDAIATHILATDAAVNTLMPNLSSASTLATSILANVGITNAKIVEFITKALDGSLFGFAFPLNQAVRVISDYVANYKTGMAADASWDADLVAAQAVVAARPVPQAVGQSFTLTTNSDNIVGGAGPDSFNAPLTTTGMTFSSLDKLDGGAGTDLITIISNTAALLPQMKSIEDVTIASSGVSSLNLVSSTGIEKLSNAGSAGNVTFINAPLVPIALSNNSGNTDIQLKSTALSGTTDNLSLSLFANAGSVTVSDVDGDASLETISINVSGGVASSGTLTVTDSGATALTITGDSALTLALADATSPVATLKTVDASAMKGDLTLTGLSTASTVKGGAGVNVVTLTSGKNVYTGGDSLDWVTAGSGNDNISLGAGSDRVYMGGNLTAADTLDGGDGSDRIYTSVPLPTSAADAARITNFETVVSQVSGSSTAATLTQTLTAYSSITGGMFTASYTDDADDVTDAATAAISFAGVGPQFTTLSFSNITATGNSVDDVVTSANTDVDDLGSFTVTASVARAVDTTSDSLTIAMGSAATGKGGIGTSTAGVITLNVTADHEETLTITNAGDDTTIGTLSATSVKTLNLGTATKKLTISNFSAPSTLKVIDATTSTGAVDINAGTFTFNGAITISGGSGNDEITGSSGNDLLSGGDGADSIIGNAGRDTIDGGAGNDTLTGGSSNDVITGGAGADTITGGGGNDNLSGGDGNDTFVEAGTDSLGVFSLTNLSSADTVSGGDGTDTIQITGTLGASASLNLSASNNTSFAGVTGVETLNINVVDAAGKLFSLALGDIALNAFGGSLAITAGTNVTQTLTVDGSAVIGSNSGIKVTAPASGLAYTIGNGIDNVIGGTGVDTVTVSNVLFLAATDTFKGGSGSSADVFRVTDTTSTTFDAAKMSGVSGFETFSIVTGGAGNDTLAITDAVAAQFRADATGISTFTRGSADTGTTKYDASAVTDGRIVLTGGGGNDTLMGGGGNDTISGGGGADSLSGGAGNDVFSFVTSATSSRDVLVDLNLGTALTVGDQILVTESASSSWASGAYTSTSAAIGSTTLMYKVSSGTLTHVSNSQGGSASPGTAGDWRVVVLDTQAYADIAAAESAANPFQDTTNAFLIIWQDLVGNVHVSFDGDGNTNAVTESANVLVDLATISGVTITTVAASLNVSGTAASSDILFA